MKKFINKFERQYNRKCKEFNFWAGIAKWANQKAKLASMECTQISADLDRYRKNLTDEIDMLSQDEES